MLMTRDVRPTDMDTINSWWDDWKFPRIPTSMLPKGLDSFVVEDKKGIIAAVWLYRSTTPLAWMEFLISDKKASKERRDAAIDFILTSVTKLADEDRLIVFTLGTNSNKSFARRLRNFRFAEGDKDTTTYMRTWQYPQD